MRILIIEDDDNLAKLLMQGFSEAGLSPFRAEDGKEGLYMLEVDSFDVIVLDWMMPELDGLQTLKEIRKKHISTPVIMLTAKAEIGDKIEGLSSGADDYLTKPFNFRELLARVQAQYRRTLSDGSNIINLQNIEVDLNSRCVTKDKKPISLTAREYDLLLLLLKNRGSYLSKFTIEDALWIDETPQSNAVQVNIYNLRKKIGKELIKSFKGLGYKVEV